MSTKKPKPKPGQISRDILNEITSRFIVNSPDDFSNSERLFFQLELALWWYMDNYNTPRFSSHGSNDFVEFVRQIHVHLEIEFSQPETKQNYKKFATYKKNVPVCGALILNTTLDKILLIKAFQSELWGLPKGKINSGETQQDCAIREVLEEVGFDITKHLNPDDCLEIRHGSHPLKLFVVPYIDERTRFAPKMAGEVEFIKWVTIEKLSLDFQFSYVVDMYDKIKSKIAELRKRKKSTPGLETKIVPQQISFSPPVKMVSSPYLLQNGSNTSPRPLSTPLLNDLLFNTSTPSPKKKKSLKEFF
jgi:mRNA-decapping enzyme subunit 2